MKKLSLFYVWTKYYQNINKQITANYHYPKLRLIPPRPIDSKKKLPTIDPKPESLVIDDNPIQESGTSLAMKVHIDNITKHNKFMMEQKQEFEIGKRHLANMMGYNPETMTQEDIDRAIEYLFPCGLFESEAKPLMKPPEEIFPPRKEAEFDESGRPYHYLFYTAKPRFYDILHTAVQHLIDLNKFEDRINFGKEKDPGPRILDLRTSKWIDKVALEKLVLEKLTDAEYGKFTAILSRLTEHPYCWRIEPYIMQYRILLSSTRIPFVYEEIVKLPDGREKVTHPDNRKKTGIASVTVIHPGTGKLSIDGQSILYFDVMQCREQVRNR